MTGQPQTPQLGLYVFEDFRAFGFVYCEGYVKLQNRQTIGWITRQTGARFYNVFYSDGHVHAGVLRGSARNARAFLRAQVAIYKP